MMERLERIRATHLAAVNPLDTLNQAHASQQLAHTDVPWMLETLTQLLEEKAA